MERNNVSIALRLAVSGSDHAKVHYLEFHKAREACGPVPAIVQLAIGVQDAIEDGSGNAIQIAAIIASIWCGDHRAFKVACEAANIAELDADTQTAAARTAEFLLLHGHRCPASPSFGKADRGLN